jgi:hypothetical protein
MIKITGFIILGVSCLLFIMIPVVPWFDLSKTQIAGIVTALIVTGEILFYLSLFILGKSFFEKIKARLKLRKAKPVVFEIDDNNEQK